jgi:hypothetical protein
VYKAAPDLWVARKEALVRKVRPESVALLVSALLGLLVPVRSERQGLLVHKGPLAQTD